MEMRHLRYFKRVAELEHMTMAANDLFVSQSHLSHVIIELETEMRVKLFDRKGRGIKLTPCGREFYRNIDDLIYQLEDAIRRARTIYKRQSSQITVATNVSTYMSALIKANQDAHPNMRIQQYSGTRHKLIRMLMDGDVDFAICCPMLTEESGIESYLMHTEQGVIIYPPGHWLENRSTVSFMEIKDERLINVGAGYGTRDVQDIYFRQMGIFPEVVIETTDTASIYDYVKNGLGVALAPKSMTVQHPDFYNQYVDISEDTVATIGLSWKRNRELGESGEDFAKTTKAFFAKLSDQTKI